MSTTIEQPSMRNFDVKGNQPNSCSMNRILFDVRVESFEHKVAAWNFQLCFVVFSSEKVWFQNQRAKVKKIQKKQLKEGGKPKDAESQEESENESKMTVKIKDENSSKIFLTLKQTLDPSLVSRARNSSERFKATSREKFSKINQNILEIPKISFFSTSSSSLFARRIQSILARQLQRHWKRNVRHRLVRITSLR